MQRMIEKSLRKRQEDESDQPLPYSSSQRRRGVLEKMASVVSEDSREMDDYGRCSGYNYELGWAKSKTFIKQLAKDNIDPSLLNEELQRHADCRRQRNWRAKCLGRFRSNIAQILLCILVLIDSGIVITQIILEIRSIQNYKELFDIHAQQLNYMMATQDFRWTGFWCKKDGMTDGLPWVAEKPPGESSHNLHRGNTASIDEHRLKILGDFLKCWKMYVEVADATKQSGCDPDMQRKCMMLNVTEISEPETSTRGITNPAMLHHASEVMHFVSIGVTGVFILSTSLKLVCLGRKFFTNIYEVTDALVILISFISDVCYIKLDSQEISAMVILLLWRIARLINAMLMYERQRCEFRVVLQKRARRLQERKVGNLQRDKELYQKQISNLEELARNFGCTEEELRDCKPRYVYHSKEQTQNALKSIAALTTGFMGGLVGAPFVQKESITRFTTNSPPVDHTNQVSPSSAGGGELGSQGAYDSPNSAKGILASLINEDGPSSPGSLSSLPSCSRKELMMRNQAENLVRNVLIHQISNAIEESEAEFSRKQYQSPRRKTCGPDGLDKGLIKSLISSNARKQFPPDGRRERGRSIDLGAVPTTSGRRHVLSPFNRFNLRFNRRASTAISSQLHHQLTNAAFDIEETETTPGNPPFFPQNVSPLLEEGTSQSTDSPPPTLPRTPILQISEIDALEDDCDHINADFENGGSDATSVSGSDGVEIDGKRKKKWRGLKRLPDIGDCRRSSEGLSTHSANMNGGCNLARRNSYCPTRLVPPDREQLLLPERKTRSENGSQPKIIRTSSERRFYVSPAPSPNSLEIAHAADRVLSNSVMDL